MFYESWIASRFLKARRKERMISVIALISMIGIALGVAVLIVVISVMSGFDRYLEDKMVGTYAHIVVDSFLPFDHSDRLIRDIKDTAGVIEVAPFILGGAVIKQAGSLISVQVRGIDPQAEPKVTKINDYIRRGDLNLSDNEVIIGQELAERLFLNIGDTVSLISPEKIKLHNFKISGLFNSGMYLYDSGLVISNIKTAENFFGSSVIRTGVSVKVSDIYKVEEIKKKITGKLSADEPFEIKSWMDLNRNFLEALKLEKLVMFIVVIMTTVVAAFGIVNTLILSAMEKTKDIGILMAIGTRVNSILKIFLFQGLGLGCLGILLGLLAGISLAGSLNKIVDFISRLIGRSLIPKDIYYFDRLPVYFNIKDIIIIVCCTFIITLLASIYPALRASRLKPTEALRYE